MEDSGRVPLPKGAVIPPPPAPQPPAIRRSVERLDAQEKALLLPEVVQIGRFKVRALSAGDVLIGRRLGLRLMSGDAAGLKVSEDELAEELALVAVLLTMSAAEVREVRAALQGGAEAGRAMLEDRLLLTIAPAELGPLIEAVTSSLGLAGEVAHEIEPKPTDGPSGPQPSGN